MGEVFFSLNFSSYSVLRSYFFFYTGCLVVQIDRVYNHNSINNNGYTDSSEALISETSNCCTDVEGVAETQQEATVDDEEDARMKSKMCMNPDQIKTCLKHNYKVKARIFRAVRSIFELDLILILFLLYL